MTSAKPTPVPAAPTARTVRPVCIFSLGQMLPSGKIADEAFVDRVIANWSESQAKGDPRFPKPPAFLIPAASVSLGHHDNSSIMQAYAERSDLPAVGWPAGRLYRQGPYLFAERFEGVPVKLAEWINAGAYKHVSAEFYEDYQGHGPTLRRVALLGADVPACKDLGPIPTLVFDPKADARANPLAFTERLADFAGHHRRFQLSLAGRPVCTFSESPGAGAMDQTLFDALIAMGVDPAKLDQAGLDAVKAACTPAPAPGTPAPTPVTPAMNSEDDEKKEPAMNSEDDEKEEKKEPAKEEKKEPAMYTEMMASVLANVMKTMNEPAGGDKGPAMYTEAAMTSFVTSAVKPLQNQLRATEAQLADATARLNASEAATDRTVVTAFVERMKAADKVWPYELDPKVGPTMVDRLLAMPSATVAKFAEGKVSPRQAEMRAIEARPPVARFTERLTNPLDRNDAASEAARLLSLTDNGRAVLRQQVAPAIKPTPASEPARFAEPAAPALERTPESEAARLLALTDTGKAVLRERTAAK